MSSHWTQAQGKRRRQGKNSIHWNSPKNQHIGTASLGLNPAYRRIRRNVAGRTKAAVRDMLRELHREAATADRASGHATLTDDLAEAVFRGGRVQLWSSLRRGLLQLQQERCGKSSALP